MNIRFAHKKDIPTLVDLCAAHAAYEKATYSIENKGERLTKALFTNPVGLTCLVIEKEQKLLGYATCIKQFSTWDADFYLYLDCLFILEPYRGQGLGKLLMIRIKEYAQAQNCIGVQWQTPDFNTKAIKFYKKLGATAKVKERFTWQV